MIMCVFLFALWLLLNGRVTVEICLFGVVIAGAVYAFCVYALGYHPSHERRLLKRLGGYVVYVAVLIWEIVKANMAVVKIILMPPHKYHPAIVRMRIPFKKNISRVILSNSITLTPGTVTINVTPEGIYEVHALTDGAAEGLLSGAMPRKVAELFGEKFDFMVLKGE